MSATILWIHEMKQRLNNLRKVRELLVGGVRVRIPAI